MQETYEARHLTDNGLAQRCECGAASRLYCHCNTEQEDTQEAQAKEEEENAAYYVLMNSRVYGTEAWPCNNLEAAIQTLCRLARSAEQQRQTDGVQRYFCIKGSDLPAQEEGVESDPIRPDMPDTDALALTIHRRETCYCPLSQAARERDMREVVRLLCQEDEARERASQTAEYGKASEVEV